MKYYHASNHNYEFPTYEDLIKNRTNHANGNLGLWISAKNNWISGFGKNIYEVDVDEADIKVIAFSQVVQWEKDFTDKVDGALDYDTKELYACAYYQTLRLELLKKHQVKVLMFKEANGSIEMGIVMDFSAIKEFKNMTEPGKKRKLRV